MKAQHFIYFLAFIAFLFSVCKKKLKIVLFLICITIFSIKVFANEVIKITWNAVSQGQGYYIYNKNITIIATENKTFTVDWGDGSNIETKTGTGGKQILSHSYADTKGYTATIIGNGTDCLFTYLDCTYHGLYKLNIGTNVSLKTLICKRNWLTELDISNCPALEYLDCSWNKLTELNIRTNPALKHLDCSWNDTWVNEEGYGNGISYLDFSNCELTYLNCSSNSLLLSNLIVASEMIDKIENKNFAHQNLPWKKTITGIPIDFSSEVEFGGMATVFDVKTDCPEKPIEENVHYTINEGIITFLEHELCNRGYIVTMTNAAIPTASVTTSFYTFDFMHILSNLTVSEGSLEPKFNSINFNYTVNVGDDVSEITLFATPNNPNTIISGTGVKAISLGNNNFIVNACTQINANSAISLDYKIKVIRGKMGITETVQSSTVKICPNPANHLVESDLGNNFMQYQSLYIYDLLGKLCMSVAVTQEKQQINIQNLSVGCYFVQVEGKGKRNVPEKLLIIR